jgi:NADH-quinone oxidoreductase subunit N
MIFVALVFLLLSSMALFIAATFKGAEEHGAGQIFGGVSLAVYTITAILAAMAWNDTTIHYGVIKSGGIAALGTIIMCGIGALTVGGVMANPEKYKAGVGEFFGFIAFVVFGGAIMVSTNNLLVLLLGIELSSYATYILVGYYRDDRFSNEAASKYFLLGAVASGFLIFGMSLVYASVAFTNGSLNYADLGNTLQMAGAVQDAAPQAVGIPALIYPGIAMLLVGFGFKLALAPFHSWTPDAYQGAPTMVAAILSVGPKAAVVIALSSLLTTAFYVPELSAAWKNAIAVLAILSMTIGNLMALQQTNLKRLLGFSSIAQLGYVVIGVAVGSLDGTSAVILYIVGYAVTNIGAFMLIATLREAGVGENIEDIAGLVKRNPFAAVMLAGFFMGLAGVPVLAGFLGKLLLFKSAIDVGMVALAVIAALNVVPSYFYYFRVIISAIFSEPKDSRTFELNATATTTLAVALGGVVLLGIFPTPLLNIINEAVKVLPLFAAR